MFPPSQTVVAAGFSVVAIVAIVLLIRARAESKALAKQLHAAEEETSRRHALLDKSNARGAALDEKISQLQELVTRLAPYQEIVDAKCAAADLRQAAEASSRRAYEAAAQTLAQAKEQASLIVLEARTKAENTAGEALKAQADHARLLEVVRAMTNVIEGYGDRYLIPTRSLIDEFASNYDHARAGRDLTLAREKTRDMVTRNEAAESDLAEPVRRTSAIRFMIDAFNGKVEAVLTRAKIANVGTLKEEIKDAFALVNHDGAAFRSRIKPAYRDARIQELRTLVVLNELREREKEEQRRAKEQMREEEKARRDYERAIREAEEEEALIKKAMIKAQAEIARASEEQRSKYEAQLFDLQARLQEAEAKNRRALSMAEQTRAGHVYIISNVGAFGEEMLKVGLTRRLDPMERVKELGDASVPFCFDVHAMIFSNDAPTLERELHVLLDDHRVNRVNYRKEFFRVSITQLREYVEKKGLQVQFTMAALAREYRESKKLAEMSPDERAQYRLQKQLLTEDSAGEN